MRAFIVCTLLCAAVVGRARCDPAAESGPVLVVLPGPDGIVDVAGAELSEEAAALPNPFRRRYRASPKTRDIAVRIEAVVSGGGPEPAAAVINGNPYAPNEEFEGMAIASIGPDVVELRRGRTLARLPVQEAPLVLRLNR